MRLFPINADDLAELERLLPDLMMSAMAHWQPRERTAWRRVQAILAAVRWQYGPPTDVEKIEPGEPTDV
jgi:hypothetical protein